MDGHIVHQGSMEFKESKGKWKSRWVILEKSDRNVPPEDIDQDNMRNSNYTSLVIRKNKEGEVKLAIPLYYLCLVDKFSIDKKTSGITLMIADKHSNTAETYQMHSESQVITDVWMDYFNEIVGSGMHKFEIKLPKAIKTKYNGPGWLFFYEEQKFITITTDQKIPQYFGTWPIQLLRRYGGDDPNKFVFESGRRCFGGVNIYHVASCQAYDIRGLCNKVSSTPRGGVSTSTGCLANSTLPGYSDNEPRYRNHQGNGARCQRDPRPLTIASNGSVTSGSSKRSSTGSNSTNGDTSARQLSLERGGVAQMNGAANRPNSDTMDSLMSFRSSNNSIISRSSRGSYSSDVNLNTEDLGDSGVDTLESRGAVQPPNNDSDPQDMYMVMQPNCMAPISETQAPTDDDMVYETMMHGTNSNQSSSSRNGNWHPQMNNGEMSHYMVPRSLNLTSAGNSPAMSPISPAMYPAMTPGMSPMNTKLINYPPSPQTVAQVPSDNYMNLGPSLSSHASTPASSHGDYMELDGMHAGAHASPTPTETPLHTPTHTLKHSASCHADYMNIDTLSRKFEKSASVDYSSSGVIYEAESDVGSYGNYMNIPSFSDSLPKAAVVKNAPIYDTPPNHLRAFAAMESKGVGMSVSNPIYGNCGTQKLQT